MEIIDIGIISDDKSEWYNTQNPIWKHKTYEDVYRWRISGISYYRGALVWKLNGKAISHPMFFSGFAGYRGTVVDAEIFLRYFPIKLKQFMVEVDEIDAVLYVKHRRELDQAWEYYGNY